MREKKLKLTQSVIDQEKEAMKMTHEDLVAKLMLKEKALLNKEQEVIKREEVVKNKAMEINDLDTTLRNTQLETHTMIEGKEKQLQEEREKLLKAHNEETLKATKRLEEVETFLHDLLTGVATSSLPSCSFCSLLALKVTSF